MKHSLANHNPVGEDEELHVGSEGTEHQAAGHHHPAEDGHGTGAKVLHADAADGTWKSRVKCQWVDTVAKTPEGLRDSDAVVPLTAGTSGQDAEASH